MIVDRVHRLQLLLRPGRRGDARRLDEADLERVFDVGEKQVARLAREVEAQTGCTLESRRALDFGCGRGRLAIPLAARCEHVYGLDVRPAVLREADRNAKRMGVDNVEWLEATRLGELSGRYDFILSMEVFPHIPTREGERLLSELLNGLRPDGVGAIHVALRPSRPLTSWLRRGKPNRAGRSRSAGGVDWSYPYMLLNSYSLNRLGRLFADAGVTEWHTKWHVRSGPIDAVTVILHKRDPNLRASSHGAPAGAASDEAALQSRAAQASGR